jgi:hypothetical protein
MSEVERLHMAEWSEDAGFGEFGMFVRAYDYDAAQSQLAALREELETTLDDLVIFKSGLSALGEASKNLVFCARTTGGTSGPDQGLMDACAVVEGAITLAGIARAMNEFERLTAERDDLKARLEQARDRKNSIVDLQQRLAAAEQRNAELVGLLRGGIKTVEVLSETPEAHNGEAWEDLHAWTFNVDAALKPAESVVCEKCLGSCRVIISTVCGFTHKTCEHCKKPTESGASDRDHDVCAACGCETLVKSKEFFNDDK